MRKTLILVFVVQLFLSLSCKQSAERAESESYSETLQSEDVVELDGAFVKFYNRFHSDSLFQLDHIQFPMSKNSQGEEGDLWNRENWIIHKSFSDMGGMFKRDLLPVGSIVVEKIIDANGFFEMERRFAELSDGWKLIYYDVKNPSEE